MARDKRRESEDERSGLIGPVVIMVIMCASVYYVLEKGALPFDVGQLLLKQATSTREIVEAKAATSTELAVAISLPNADRDRLYRIRLPEKSVEEVAVQEGWRESALVQKPLQLEVGRNQDEVTVLSGTDWNTPLRTRRGTPYLDAMFLGLFDPSHAAVLARGSDRFLLSVSRLGEIRELKPVTENVAVLLTEGGFVWMATFLPGEGIESPPQGPSNLLRVDGDGSATTVATEKAVISRVLPSQKEAVAYETEMGDMVATSLVGTWKGQGRPLLWLDEGHLFMTQGRGILLLDIQTGTLTEIATLPAQPSRAVLSAVPAL